MTDERVRAVAVTPGGGLLTIERLRPGRAPYHVLPGGGVESGETLRQALDRELREELAATVEVHGLLYVLDRPEQRQYFYLVRVHTWSFVDRSGPEFTDPTRGRYRLTEVSSTAEAIAALDLKPEEIAGFLTTHLRRGDDLFALPDLRAAPTPHH